ncbi:hypothetical protein [Cetobacterium sp.]|uniref:hypothetical protein n=1 Tax=Cetobacterium sp. TaxID=2071632 RepID=UPI003F2A9E80
MNLNFVNDMMGGDQVVNSEKEDMKYVVLKTETGEITFTYKNDERLNDAFKDCEQLGEITKEEHEDAINRMNSCQWYLKIEFVDGKFVEVEKYTPEKKLIVMQEMEESERKAFYSSEREIALEIEEDYRLDLEDITEEQIIEVKTYIKSIKPTKTLIKKLKVERPEIMEVYKKRRKEN